MSPKAGFPNVADAIPPPEHETIISLTVAELLERPFPPRGQIVAPVLAEKSLTMLYAPRGIGKTWIAGTVAAAAASGSVVLPAPCPDRPAWAAPTPRRVILFDGEMPARVLRDRLAQIIAGGPYEPGDRLRIVADDVQAEGLPSFVRPDAQARMDHLIGDAELVLFDNSSTLFRGLDENDSQEWEAVQEWLIRLRREGRSVLLVHHAGKAGQQRGTSKREDVLDLVVALRRPENYVEEEGCRVEIHLEKARGITGPDVLPFEAKLTVSHGMATWKTAPLADEELNAKITALRAAGMPTRKIAGEVGLDQSTIVRRLAKVDRRLKLAADAREKGDAHRSRIGASGG